MPRVWHRLVQPFGQSVKVIHIFTLINKEKSSKKENHDNNRGVNQTQFNLMEFGNERGEMFKILLANLFNYICYNILNAHTFSFCIKRCNNPMPQNRWGDRADILYFRRKPVVQYGTDFGP